MKKIILTIAAFAFYGISANAQVKIGDNPTTVGASSLLELESTTKGLVLPRVTTNQRTNVGGTGITTPVIGMQVYDTDIKSIFVCTAVSPTVWKEIGSATASNGLTATAGEVKLGGALTAATTIDQAANDLTFSGTTGILKMTKSSTTNPILAIENTVAGNVNAPNLFTLYSPNQITGRNSMRIGQSSTSKNEGVISYLINGLGGDTNQIQFGINNVASDLLSIYSGGQVYVRNQLGIGTSTPDAKALLDLTSTTKGFLLPRMSTAQRTGITAISPIGLPTGLQVYDTTTNSPWYYNGTSWVDTANTAATAWGLTGNTGMVDGTNYIGTNATNDVALAFKVNGIRAGSTGSSAAGNVSFGYEAGLTSATDQHNTAIGFQALKTASGSTNTAIGYKAATAVTTATSTTAVGDSALAALTSGTLNTAVGQSALAVNTTGGSNIAIGAIALDANTTGNSNTAVGTDSMGDNTTGAGNSALGYRALWDNTTGTNNVAIGNSALNRNVTGIGNTAIGTVAGPAAGSLALNYSTAIGYGAEVSADNSIVLGATTGVGVANVGIGTTAPTEKLTVISSNDSYATNIASFTANNLSAGVSIGYNEIRASGTNLNNNLSISAKGTGNLLLQSSGTGKVGIGTTAPDSALSMRSGDLTTNEYITIGRTSTEMDLGVAGTAGAGLSGTVLGDSWMKGATNLLIGTTAGNLGFLTNNTRRMTISSTGNVGIGTTAPVASAALEITSTTKGFLMPRMDTTARTAIASPATGLQVYDTSLNSIFYYNGSSWVNMALDTTSATNGLNVAAGKVGLGGALAADTTVDTAGFDLDAKFASATAGTLSLTSAGLALPASSTLDNGRLVLQQDAAGSATMGNRILIRSFPTVGANRAGLTFYTSRGTAASPANLASGLSMNLGRIEFNGYINNTPTQLGLISVTYQGTGISNETAMNITNSGTLAMTIDKSNNVGINTLAIPITSKLQVVGLPTYANEAAAAAGGLTLGAFYKTAAGVVMVKL